MAGDSSDQGSGSPEEVQDYLDLLLTSATEKPENQVDHVVAEELSRGQAIATPLSQELQTSGDNIRLFSARTASQSRVAAGSAAFAKSPARTELPSHSGRDSDQHRSPQRRSSDGQPAEPRPFAEPIKPLPLKTPVFKSEVKAETKSKTQALTTAETKTESKTQVESPPEAPAAVTSATATTTTAKLAPSPVVTPAPAEALTEAPAPAQPQEVTEPIVSDRVEADTAVAEKEAFKPTEWLNGRPSWAQERFECLLFSVGGLTLAVPLVELGSIYPKGEEITPIFGQIDWFMGLLRVKEGNLRTVDTAKIVMPERYQQSMRENYHYVISINAMNWGLAVDSVANAVVLEPEDVKWRSERSKRPWLAGTVVEHMCALMDISQLAVMFKAVDSRDSAD